MVALVVAVAVASLVGVAGATGEPDDTPLGIAETSYEVGDPAAGPGPTAGLPQALTATFADDESAPAAVQPTPDEAVSSASEPLAAALVDEESAPAAVEPTHDGASLGSAVEADNSVDDSFGQVADEARAPQPVELAEADLEERTELTLHIREIEEYDPWEPFNEKTFAFNRKLDQFVLKPVAKVWDKLLPDVVQRGLGNAFDNLSMPRRLVNEIFQLRLTGAGLELARFLLNSTVGVGGLFDAAKVMGIEKKEADTGQTLGVYGIRPGPYLVVPFLPTFTVRDGIGLAVDGALDPFNYVIFPVAALWGLGIGKRVNDRSANLELFENVEETVIDLYSAVRNGYLQRRDKVIRDALREQVFR
jgi:phospholipid-binding lipoprotein MlaA